MPAALCQRVITTLTAQHVVHEDGRTLLRLGSRPVILPARWTASSPGSGTAEGLRRGLDRLRRRRQPQDHPRPRVMAQL